MTILFITVAAVSRHPGHPRHRVHEALAVASRVRLLDVLRSSGRALNAAELARRCGIHVSTVRFHLRILNEAGLVRGAAEQTRGPGRPPLLYTATNADAADSADYRTLATMLAAHWGGGSTERAESAERAGYTAAAEQIGSPPRRRPSVDEAMERVAAMFADLGFAPEVDRDGENRRLQLHACPFRAVAIEHPEVVCSLHLGLLKGALAVLDAPATVGSLMPFVEPDLCLAVVTPTP